MAPINITKYNCTAGHRVTTGRRPKNLLSGVTNLASLSASLFQPNFLGTLQWLCAVSNILLNIYITELGHEYTSQQTVVR